MDDGESLKVIDKVAAEVAVHARLGEEARNLLTEGMPSRHYLARLIEWQLHADAVQFLAHALPKREAVWWACLCVGEVLDPEPTPAAVAALKAAEAWVIDPKDERRRATLPAAKAADVGTPAGCTAASAYFSGGSLAPADLPVIAPAEHLTAHLVASALTLAAVIKEPEKAAEKYASFLRFGLEVASGQRTCPEAAEENIEKERGAAYGYARRARR